MSENDNDNMSLEDVLKAIADEVGIENPVLEIEVEDEPPSNDQCQNCGAGMLWEYGDDDVPNSGRLVCPVCADESEGL